jgi:hypothetical protein
MTDIVMTDIGGDLLHDNLNNGVFSANAIRGLYTYVLFVISLDDYNIKMDAASSLNRMATFQVHEGPSKFGTSIYAPTSKKPLYNLHLLPEFDIFQCYFQCH